MKLPTCHSDFDEVKDWGGVIKNAHGLADLCVTSASIGKEVFVWPDALASDEFHFAFATALFQQVPPGVVKLKRLLLHELSLDQMRDADHGNALLEAVDFTGLVKLHLKECASDGGSFLKGLTAKFQVVSKSPPALCIHSKDPIDLDYMARLVESGTHLE
nr:hypothetical protein B0A51_01441 [Rachicladosporium sp. CCFEE 5018]